MSLKGCETCSGHDAGTGKPGDGERVKLGGGGRAKLCGAEGRVRRGGGETAKLGVEEMASGGGAECATSCGGEGSCCVRPSSRPRPGSQTGSRSAQIRRRLCAQPAAGGTRRTCQAGQAKHLGQNNKFKNPQLQLLRHILRVQPSNPLTSLPLVPSKALTASSSSSNCRSGQRKITAP